MGKLAGGFIDVYLLEKSRYICSKSFFFMLGFFKVSLEIQAILFLFGLYSILIAPLMQ